MESLEKDFGSHEGLMDAIENQKHEIEQVNDLSS
jgi:hypothetical protein